MHITKANLVIVYKKCVQYAQFRPNYVSRFVITAKHQFSSNLASDGPALPVSCRSGAA